MKRFISFSLILCLCFSIQAQKIGVIKGKTIDKEKQKPMSFVNLTLLQNGVEIFKARSDFDGFYAFDSLKAGTYTIEAISVGYKPLRLAGIKVDQKKTYWVMIPMESSSIEMMAFEVVNYRNKLIDKGNAVVKTPVSQEDFKSMAVRSAPEIPINTAGVYSLDNGSGSLNIRGARSDANYYYIDGMKVVGSSNLPQTSYYMAAETNTEEYNPITDNRFKDVRTHPLSTFSIDVDNASYTNVRRFINQGILPPADAVRVEEMINYFNYDYPQPVGSDPFSITTEYTYCPWNTSHKLVHIGIQGKEVDMNEAAPNNLVFLIDVSGSMGSRDKLPLLKKGMFMLIDQLRAEDQVAIVVYAGAAGLVLPSTPGSDKKTIKNAISHLNAGGSTAGGAGIQLAYQVAKENFLREGNNRIILASDGDFNVGISDQNDLIKLIESKRDQGIFLTTIGFGTGNYKDSKMEQLANKGNGVYYYIDNAREAQKVFVTEMGGTLITIAKDVKVQVEFNPANVKGYRLIGYVNRKLNNEDFNDDTKDAGEIGSGHSVTMLYEIIPASSGEMVIDIDALKYQKDPVPVPVSVSQLKSELLTVKFRYKEPKGKSSKLISKVVMDKTIPFAMTSENCRFSASVASFAMLLRQSKLSKDYDYDQVIHLAKGSKGVDNEGLRSEFIQLVKLVAVL